MFSRASLLLSPSLRNSFRVSLLFVPSSTSRRRRRRTVRPKGSDACTRRSTSSSPVLMHLRTGLIRERGPGVVASRSHEFPTGMMMIARWRKQHAHPPILHLRRPALCGFGDFLRLSAAHLRRRGSAGIRSCKNSPILLDDIRCRIESVRIYNAKQIIC